MKKNIFLFLLFLVLLSKLVLLSSCANIIPPEGGPRDTIPPVLLKVSPQDSSRNFNGRTIVFTFDEFVDVQNARENLLVSPLPRREPEVSVRLKTVTLRLKDSLESNTTYSFNFGKSVRDYTEGNAVRDLTYTFSTGPMIDSMELRGKVILAESGKIDTTLIVMLHSSPNDSAVVKERPRYIAKLDSKGNFVFKNLPVKTFYLYALKEQGGTYRYLGDKDLFAFADKPVDLRSAVPPVTLYAYAASKGGNNAAVSSGPTLAPNLNINNRRGRNETVDTRLKYQTSLVNNQQDLLTPFTLSFERPLRSFDSTKLTLFTDSAFTPVPQYRFRRDSTHMKVILITEWKENTLYHLILNKDFADDSSGKKLLKTDTLSFRTKKLSEYGSLKLKFKNLPLDKNPVLQFIQNETVYRSFPLTGNEFSQSLFLPAEYELRLLFDKNKNGVWDPGEFFGKHIQPEIVQPIDRKITVKPAWQNEFELSL